MRDVVPHKPTIIHFSLSLSLSLSLSSHLIHCLLCNCIVEKRMKWKSKRSPRNCFRGKPSFFKAAAASAKTSERECVCIFPHTNTRGLQECVLVE